MDVGAGFLFFGISLRKTPPLIPLPDPPRRSLCTWSPVMTCEPVIGCSDYVPTWHIIPGGWMYRNRLRTREVLPREHQEISWVSIDFFFSLYTFIFRFSCDSSTSATMGLQIFYEIFKISSTYLLLYSTIEFLCTFLTQQFRRRHCWFTGTERWNYDCMERGLMEHF